MESNIWTEKYRPKTFDDIYLPSIEKNKIEKWLVQFRKNTKKESPEKIKNCLLLHGPPGIGKTSIAHTLLKKFDYDIIEFNASDLRSQKILNEKINQINGNINIVNFMCQKKKKIGIIIDELDGINNTERGAISELTKIIEKSGKKGSPFICITNTISKKIMVLKKKTNYIKLNKPNRPIIKKLINNILEKEKKVLDEHSKKLIIDNSQLDFRRTIILLEYILSKNTKPDDIPCVLENFEKKTQDRTIFESTEMILSNYRQDFYDIYSANKNMIGLYIYENFLNYIIKNRDETNKKKIENICQIYEMFSLSDNIEYKILIEHNHNYILDNIICNFKCNNPSFIINNMKKFSYNKVPSINYSTLLNKTSLEYQNSKNIKDLSLLLNIEYSNIQYIYDILFSYFRDNNKKKLKEILGNFNISKTELEKYFVKSSFYNKDIHTNLKKKIKNFY